MGKTKRPCLNSECRRLFTPDVRRPSYCADCYSKHYQLRKQQQVPRKDTRKKGRTIYDDTKYRQFRTELLSMATHCAICKGAKSNEDPFQVDHIFPVSKGGTNEPNNLRAVHRSCNIRKKNRYEIVGIK